MLDVNWGDARLCGWWEPRRRQLHGRRILLGGEGRRKGGTRQNLNEREGDQTKFVSASLLVLLFVVGLGQDEILCQQVAIPSMRNFYRELSYQVVECCKFYRT